ncbi:MAG: hypothetical protein ACT4QG_03055 [Sporichthyaceae bacterium]
MDNGTAQKADEIVRIRRPWSEEFAFLGVMLVGALVVVGAMGKHNLLGVYAVTVPLYVVYNRRMGVDLGPDGMTIRRPYRRAVVLRRAEIADVYVAKNGNARFVAVRDVRGRVAKLTIMNSLGKFGLERVDRTHRQMWRWWRSAESAPQFAQMPGSASI